MLTQAQCHQILCVFCACRLRDTIDRILASDRALSLVVAMVSPLWWPWHAGTPLALGKMAYTADGCRKAEAGCYASLTRRPSSHAQLVIAAVFCSAVPSLACLLCLLCCAGDGPGGWAVRRGGAPAGRVQGM